jgi:hypothetical protein
MALLKSARLPPQRPDSILGRDMSVLGPLVRIKLTLVKVHHKW